MSDPFASALDAEFAVTSEPAPAKDAKAQDAPPAEPKQAPPQKFRREIDLGDGSGVQVFEGDTLEALADKLVEAQRNATKKIREQNRQLKQLSQERRAPEPKREPPKPLSPDEFYVLSQKAVSGDVGAWNTLLEHSPAYQNQRQAIEELTATVQEVGSASMFISLHRDDYLPTPENYEKIQNFLDSRGLSMTLENLESAFSELSASGLLEKPKPVQSAPARIEQPTEVKKPASVGLSDRMQATPTAVEPDALNAEVAKYAKAIQDAPTLEAARAILDEARYKLRLK